MSKKDVKKCKILNERQKTFVNALASGKDRIEAYISAYPNAKSRDRECVARCAYNLLRRTEVMDAYQDELDRKRKIEDEKNRWTYERSIDVRLNAIKAIEDERERRRIALETMARAMMTHPPAGMSPEDVVLEVQRILMMPVLTNQTTSALTQLCESLDRLTGLNREGVNSETLVILGENDVDE